MIGVLGGSGFYTLLEDVRRRHLQTPFGEPSGDFALGTLDGIEVAFLPRHGRGHTIPPAQINYRANLWAMQELGVTQVIAPTAASAIFTPGPMVEEREIFFT